MIQANRLSTVFNADIYLSSLRIGKAAYPLEVLVFPNLLIFNVLHFHSRRNFFKGTKLFQHLDKFFLHVFVNVAVAGEGLGALSMPGKLSDKVRILDLFV